MYPFRITKAVPPLHVPKILTFHFKTLALFELDAEDFVRQHHACMYPLVPTMNNVHANLIDQVIQELKENIQTLQRLLVNLVRARYPDLAELA